jgi:hypothetical protein
VKKPTAVILSAAKDLRSWFWFNYSRRTAEMLLPQSGISMTDSNFFMRSTIWVTGAIPFRAASPERARRLARYAQITFQTPP